MGRVWKEDKIAARNRNVRCQAGTLRADRFFHHLHKDRVANFHKFRDVCIFELPRFNRANITIPFKFHIEHLLELLGVLNDVADMDKSILSFIDRNEGRLDVVENINDLSAIDVSGKQSVGLSLND